MYSPTTRLLTVLELLQSYKRISGAEIAQQLEVDRRTVRRYITMLQDMGIPVEAERGPYGAYELQRGRKLPPMLFTDSEAIALTLGLVVMREFNFPVDVAAVEGALAKTERVLPENLLHQTRSLQETIEFQSSANPYGVPLPPKLSNNNFVSILSSAVKQHQRVFFRYTPWNGGETEREFDPYGIVNNIGYWYVAGFCHVRHDLRSFRLDRITQLEVCKQTFEPPADFNVLNYVLSSIAIPSTTEQIEVLLETSIEHAQELISPVMGTLEETSQGVIFRRAANQLEWIASVLMNFDVPIHVVENDALRHLLKQIAKKALQMIDENP